MRELKLSHQDKVSEVRHEKRVEYVGRCNKIPGLTMYQFNQRTGEICLPKYEVIATFDTKGNPITRNKIVSKEGHVYGQFLNVKNAAKKFAKYFIGC
jgi:hypothetical protein